MKASWREEDEEVNGYFTAWNDNDIYYSLEVKAPRIITKRLASEVEALERGVEFSAPWTAFGGKAAGSYERPKLIWKFADQLEANRQLATELEVLDNGMPRMAAMYSIAKFGCEFLRYYAGWTTKINGETIPVSPHEARNRESLT